MRILIISTNVVRWGGSEELWYNVANRLIDLGHEVMVSVFMHRPLANKVLLLKNKGVKIHQRPFPSYFKGQRFTGRVLAEFKLRTGLDKSKLDWVSVAKWNPNAVLISSGETFDYTINHESFIIKHCTQKQVPYYLISQFNWEHDMDIDTVFRESHKELSQKANGHFFVSYRNLKNAEMQISGAISNARIIANPIKLKLDNPLPFPSLDTIKIAIVARLQTYIKGQDLFLQAISSDEFKSVDFKISLYGSGDDLEHIKNLIQFYSLQGKVELKGKVHDIAKIWEEHHLLALPSRAEGTSLSLLEAMMCGRTAIVTNVGDSALVIGNRGYVSESNTVESLRETLKIAFSKKNNWETLGVECRDFVLENMKLDQDLEIAKCLTQEIDITEVGVKPEEYLNRSFL